MNYEVACSSMNFLATLGQAGFLENAGVSQGDFKRLISNMPWLASERNRMTVTLQTLILGSVDALGLPRFNLPAEYNAAGIALFVHPINVHAACVFLATSPDAETMGRKNDSTNINKIDHVEPSRLFALVQQLYASEARTSARVLFGKNTGLALDAVKKESK